MYQKFRRLFLCCTPAKAHSHDHDLLCPPEDFPVEIQPVSWVDAIDGNIPDNAFAACTLDTGETAYVVKAEVEASFIQPGITTKNLKEAHLANRGYYRVLREQKFQVMVTDYPNSLCWKQYKEDIYQKSAVAVGKFFDDKYLICKTCGPLTDGRINLTHERLEPLHDLSGSLLGSLLYISDGNMYAPFNGKVSVFNSFEILCHKLSPSSLLAMCKWRVLKILCNNNERRYSINVLPLPVSMKEFLLAKMEPLCYSCWY
ncbi:unnamed protein product [Clavelina lepadiformis]|uniref:SOCS box domain-containing protein n=1 Tax=Clavelina lepadiformis TaxID=159417 RepID=A0ABP0H3F5_CLALP